MEFDKDLAARQEARDLAAAAQVYTDSWKISIDSEGQENFKGKWEYT